MDSSPEEYLSTFENRVGNYSLSKYDEKIYKIIFHFADHSKTENITQAVIKKPVNDTPSINKGSHGADILVNWDKAHFIVDNTRLALQENQSFQVLDTFITPKEYGFVFQLSKDEKIFGGGEKALSLNRRGHSFPIVNNPWYGYSYGADNLNFSVPFFLSSKGYALFFDNGSKGHIDIGKTSPTEMRVSFSSGEINFFLILGEDYKALLLAFTKLTGTQPLPPKWIFGNFMSRFGYTSQEQTNSILLQMEEAQMPVSAIIFDLFWFGDTIKGTMGNLDWISKENWPDPKQMIDEYKAKGIQSILIAEPFILKGTKNYDKLINYTAITEDDEPYTIRDFYFGPGSLLDIFRQDTQQKIWELFYQKQLDNGVSAWWTDLGEPESHPPDVYHNCEDEGILRRMGADEVHNLYAHYWSKMLFEKYAEHLPNERLFHLTRAGFAGSQRYSIFPWSGDVSRSWAGLRAQLPIMLGMSLCGIPYVHADAGGFAGGESDNELFIRWLQFAAYTPVFRPHGTALYTKDPMAISFPSEAALFPEPFKSYARKIIENRYALLPYNYTLAYLQTTKGEPLAAPIFYYYPNYISSYSTDEIYCWGEQMIIAPVLQKGKRMMRVELPGSYNWYLNNTDMVFTSAATIKLSLNQMPVFVKEGAIIPEQFYIDGEEVLLFKYYFSDVPSESLLYEDDGLSKDSIEKGNYVKTEFITGFTNNVVTISVTLSGNGFQGFMPSKTNYLKVFGAPKKLAGLRIREQYFSANKEGLTPFILTNTNEVIILVFE